MIHTLNRFTTESLFDATSHLLAKLHIEFDRETAEPISVADLYDGPMPQYLIDALLCIKDTYFIGVVNDQSLAGNKNDESSDETIRHAGKYDGMFVFACDAKHDANLTRSAASALTRAFNRISAANPVILIIRQDNLLSLATCERMTYSQEWRQGGGEKLGKVTILRNINCEAPHRGHVDILDSIGNKAYHTFEDLYKHWMEVFSNELLTKKFYNELSDWYAWAVMVAKFPNDLCTDKDDEKYNHEACIRLITRLIFVWFLKQKHLIPEEFFDENYIRENLIEEFDPHVRKTLLYDAEDSKYYRLILQNLFFAMLNCPIVAEGKTTPNNRRFMRESFQGKNPDFGINNIMRYKKEFKECGADKMVKLANSRVPFLNGGLFDCLDNKDTLKFYDGFSEEKKSLEQLSLPDYLFFGEEMGKGIDLSQWYDDKKKKNVSARGLIDILKRYSFTIEENTPYDQEVSLDPELLGKVFENLLAAYNPETKQSARKQTGSFYTPREIVQYMVDESLVAHLKRMCGDDMEPQYRQLLSYAADDVTLSEEQRKGIMNAIYNCRVLDPACGSGAFPMGVLQQMVHVLKRIDPSNKMWESMMVDIAIAEAKKELMKVTSGNDAEKAKIEENRQARLDDIENAFNQSINDPDYARKLYLIEHCIYGVDIQPIATQISKLRFFISLVVDQKPTKDAKSNFGIRPLPNLEAKFVTANTLIPLDRSRDLFSSSEDIRFYEEQLQDINHRIFLAKKNSVKKQLQQDMYATRATMAQVMENNGFIGSKGHDQLMSWDMFNQNSSASFFDPEWMFGVKGGFDVVIANPPFVLVQALNDEQLELTYNSLYEVASYKIDLFHLFIEKGIKLLKKEGCLVFINPTTYLTNKYTQPLRDFLLKNTIINKIINIEDDVFTASVNTGIEIIKKDIPKNSALEYCHANLVSRHLVVEFLSAVDQKSYLDAVNHIIQPRTSDKKLQIIEYIDKEATLLKSVASVKFGMQLRNRKVYTTDVLDSPNPNEITAYHRKCYTGKDIMPYVSIWHERYCFFHEDARCGGCWTEEYHNTKNKILVRQVGATPVCGLDEDGYAVLNSAYMITCYSVDPIGLLALLNSKLLKFYWEQNFEDKRKAFPKIKGGYLELLPIIKPNNNIIDLTKTIISQKKVDVNNDTSSIEQQIDHLVYHLYNLTYDEVLIIDPETPITREDYDNFRLD